MEEWSCNWVSGQDLDLGEGKLVLAVWVYVFLTSKHVTPSISATPQYSQLSEERESIDNEQWLG